MILVFFVGNDDDMWTYSSEEEEKPKVPDAGVIKMEVDSHVSAASTVSSSSAVESFLKMISKSGGNPANVDASLLSKVASVINIPSTSMMPLPVTLHAQY